MRAYISGILAVCLWTCAQACAQDVVIRNAKIIDPRARTVTSGALWIKDGRIVAPAPKGFKAVDADVLDVQGRWVIPGLVDMHVHSYGNVAPGGVVSANSGTQVLADNVQRVGVTAFLDLFAPEDLIFDLRDQQRAGRTADAEILAAGPCFTATKGHCSEYGIPTRIINSPGDAREQLAQLLPKVPDVVKVVYDHYDNGKGARPTISFDTLQALVQGATRGGFKTIVHVGTWQDVRDSVKAGAAAVTHVPGDGLVPDDIGSLMAAHKVVHIPTIGVRVEAAEFYDHPEILKAPVFLSAVSTDVKDAYQNLARDEGLKARASEHRTARPVIVESVRRLHAAGVGYLVGTDAGNLWVLHGFSVHREMRYLVDAGLSPWEALAAATTNAGDFLGKRFGVGAGDAANLVILNASPLEAISNTEDIWKVVVRGRVLNDPLRRD